MSLHEVLYTAGNILVLPFWFMMIAAPLAALSRRVMRSLLPIMVIGVMYVVSLVASFSNPQTLSFDLNGIAALLGNPAGAATGWLHFLAFDLFVGRWVYLDSRERQLTPIWMVSITIFFVLMAGPFGLLLYLGLRYWRQRAAFS